MAAADFVQVTVSLTGAASVTRQGFGVPLVAGFHTHYTDRVRLYAAAGALVAMAGDGFLPTEPLYKAVSAIVEQEPCPSLVAVGRRALPMTQTLTLACTDAAQGDTYTITVIGSDGVTHLVSYPVPAASTTAAVATAIAALLSALTNIGVVTHAANVITLTQAPGLLTDLVNWSGNFVLSDTTADPGIATDLLAIAAYNSAGWYGLALDSNSAAEVEAAAAYAEATGVGGKFFAWNNSDHADVTVGDTDVFSVLAALSYRRDVGFYSGRQLLSYTGAAMLGLMLPFNPGFASFAYKTVAGVLADSDASLTEDQALILNTMTAGNPGPGGKKGNYYKTQAGLDITWPGVTPSGEWADVVIFIDWLQVNAQADVLAFIAGQPKVPFTDFGAASIGNVIKNRLKIGASKAYGGIDAAQPIVVAVPLVDTVDATNKVARNLPNVTASATLSGAILTTGVAITLTE
jgi:Protein of unknown function (DUF3383)